MKKMAFLLAVCICFSALCLNLASCGPEPSGGGSYEAEANNGFSFMFSGLDRNDLSHPAAQAMKQFETDTGRTIDFATSGYDETEQKLVAAVASGKPYDLIHAGAANFPYMAVIGYVQDVAPYCNMEDANLDRDIMDDLFSYNGKIYGVSPANNAKPLVVFYNENMFTDEGVDTPDVYYENGNWNFDKFKEVAMKFTKDTNGDGAYDRWGVACWYQYAFFSGTGGSVCTINEKGEYEVKMSGNAQLQEALELIQSGWGTDNWIGLEGDDINQSFFQGKNAMLCDYSWSDIVIYDAKAAGTMSFDYGVVPFPYGNTNTKKTNSCFADGFAIMDGCDAPYTAGKLIEYLMDAYVKDAKADNDKLDPDHVALYQEMTRNIFNATQFDSAVDSGTELCGAVASNAMNIQQAIETYEPVYTKMAQNANKKMAKKQEELKSAAAAADAASGESDGE